MQPTTAPSDVAGPAPSPEASAPALVPSASAAPAPTHRRPEPPLPPLPPDARPIDKLLGVLIGVGLAILVLAVAHLLFGNPSAMPAPSPR